MTRAQAEVWVWRHPRVYGTEQRCVGRADPAPDPRRARRLADRIRRTARRHGLARYVVSSPSRRCAAVARWLRRWGWRHERFEALLEMDFGDWEGRAWSDIGREPVEAWCADFLRHRPGGGESLLDMLARVGAWQAPPGTVVVAHAGWMLARRWLERGDGLPEHAGQWPAAPRHGELWLLPAARLPLPAPAEPEPAHGA